MTGNTIVIPAKAGTQGLDVACLSSIFAVPSATEVSMDSRLRGNDGRAA
jgi:hypothetical protein